MLNNLLSALFGSRAPADLVRSTQARWEPLGAAGIRRSDRIGERDPPAERLFEGFVFLKGRLRHKLADELAALTEALVSMVWPHYLRMIPSLPDLMTLGSQDLNLPAGWPISIGGRGESSLCLASARSRHNLAEHCPAQVSAGQGPWALRSIGHDPDFRRYL
ncbi:hypothetical protein OR16_22183 [Cupriavidus basilensis OR16]|uniref:Uncharacterized protein n=1 Tax=Cupriavidus basilensis OR16 TaxID=1127483 RepID=H1S8W5_9BURK|nr:hypothetical protein OR16_22183 [Cupriavidus basilensis OR16]